MSITKLSPQYSLTSQCRHEYKMSDICHKSDPSTLYLSDDHSCEDQDKVSTNTQEYDAVGVATAIGRWWDEEIEP